MMIRSYLDWSRNATAEDRALAVGVLAELYLVGELSVEDRRNAEAALTLVLDDHAILVRMTLAEILGGAERVPRHIITGLLQDHADVAQLVIANSPILLDHELIACLQHEEPMVHVAVAQRNRVSSDLSTAVIMHGDRLAVQALLENNGAEIREASVPTIIERFGEDGAIREMLINRPDLPVEIRITLVEVTTRQLVDFASDRGWLSTTRAARVRQETTETGSLFVAVDAEQHELAEAVSRLRLSGQLTPQMLLRSLLCGNTRLLTAALADLAGVTAEKAHGFVHGHSMAGFKALYRKSNMPEALLPAFEAGLVAWHEQGSPPDANTQHLSLAMVERVITTVAVLDPQDKSGLLLLLGRFQAEAARIRAQEHIADILAQEPLKPLVEEIDIQLQLEHALQLEFRQAA